LFLGFGYKVDVRCTFRSQQMQAGMQALSAILIRVSLFNRFIIEKALFHISNIGSTSSAKILLSGAIARLPPWLWAWLPFNYFKIASLEFPWYLPYVFSLGKLFRNGNYLQPQKTLWFAIAMPKKYLSSQLE